MIDLIIADNHPIMINGLKSILENDSTINVIGEAINSNQLLILLKTKQPDIILLDAAMHEQEEIEVARIIRKQHPQIKILFISHFDYKWLVKKCFDTGANGYLLKGVPKQEFQKAIHLVYKGDLNFFYKES